MNDKYEVVFEKNVAELKSKAILLRHAKTGARVFVMHNDDDNKVFYIGFRTPPTDSTGVPHIMEHSTLCGSEKFPLKDPFVELAKGSMNTFLNAMTYPDKTVYPVASRNTQDFRNLQDVYMDAVFHPNVYKHPEILKQEGWSYHLDSPEGELTYNGVVYNEMKGAFSSPDDLLQRKVLNTLFPDNTYGVESGGDPEFIPDLTYEEFINFHKKYYHPSNSYIFLYGDIDVDEQLEWMDREYLGKYDQIKVESDICPQKAFVQMSVTEEEYPITDDEPEEDNTYLSYNVVCGSVMDIKKVIAMQVITYALVDTQGAPIRQRLLDEGIGKDIMSLYDEGVLQPYFSIEAKNANADQKDRFLEIINEEFAKAAREGIDRQSLKAGLNSMWFKSKEADFGGYPKGLVYGLTCLNTWLYDDNSPLLHIEVDGVFAELEKDIDSGYFEDVVKEFFIGNNHASLVIMKPRKGLAAEQEARVAEKLADYKNSLSEEEIAAIVEDTKALARYQEEPATREELESIPLLERSDMKREPEEFSNIETEAGGVPIIWHDYNTNGILYYSLIFDANKISKELFPYLGLIKSVVSFVDTADMTYSQLNNEINIYAGGFSMETGIYGKRSHRDKFMVLSDISVKAMYENVDKTFDIAESVLFTGKYDDEKRMYEIIAELKSKLQMMMISGGHMAASHRASSYYSKLAALKEEINGIEFCKFIEELEKNYQSRKGEIIANVKKLVNILFSPDGFTVSATCDAEGLEILKKRLVTFKERLDTFAADKTETETQGTSTAGSMHETGAEPQGKTTAGSAPVSIRDRLYDFDGNGFTLKQKNEAFKTSGSVNYLARAGQFIDSSSEYKGAVNVFQTIMRYEYMWFNIRVQGGAYGCMCNNTAAGDAFFVTYRDPHIKRSNDVFEGIPEYLESFDCDDREMTKFVIGTMSRIDSPLSPAAKGTRDMLGYLGETDFEERRRIRHEIIDCTQADIRSLAPQIRRALDGGNICCVGSEKKIREDSDIFAEVRNLIE